MKPRASRWQALLTAQEPLAHIGTHVTVDGAHTPASASLDGQINGSVPRLMLVPARCHKCHDSTNKHPKHCECEKRGREAARGERLTLGGRRNVKKAVRFLKLDNTIVVRIHYSLVVV